MTLLRAALGAVVLFHATALALWGNTGVTCSRVEFEGVTFSTCVTDLDQAEMRLWLRDPQDNVWGSFLRLEQSLPEGQILAFAMNGGMYHADRRPVGLYIENGQEVQRLITNEGPGNFGMLPNGVFCLAGARAQVIESRAFAANRPVCDYATQSGPMLVIDGALHPNFLIDSPSRYLRNGVGVDATGRFVTSVISDRPVNFHHFARLFRDEFGIQNALFLEGNVSRFYAPSLGRADFGLPLGPILGAVVTGPPAQAR